MKCKNLDKIRVNSYLTRSGASLSTALSHHPPQTFFPTNPPTESTPVPAFRHSFPSPARYGLTLPLPHTAPPHHPHYHHLQIFLQSVHPTAINSGPAFSLSLFSPTRPAASLPFLGHYWLSKLFSQILSRNS